MSLPKASQPLALPWARTSGAGSLATGDVTIALLACGNASSPTDMLRRMLSFRSPTYDIVDGCVVAPPGAAYEVEIKLREHAPRAGALRVVRCTIDGTEVNEQLVLRSSSTAIVGKFIGWLQDETGMKRIHFTFPTNDRESLIQVGVFEATQIGAAGKKRAAPSPPASATGASFEGPLVDSARYELGAPVAIGTVRFRAALPR
jgi:hypothetical protein